MFRWLRVAGSPRPYADPQQSACLTRTDLSLSPFVLKLTKGLFVVLDIWSWFFGFGVWSLRVLKWVLHCQGFSSRVRTPSWTLCLRSHIAPIPVQRKKNSDACFFEKVKAQASIQSGLDDEHGTQRPSLHLLDVFPAVHKVKQVKRGLFVPQCT